MGRGEEGRTRGVEDLRRRRRGRERRGGGDAASVGRGGRFGREETAGGGPDVERVELDCIKNWENSIHTTTTS